VTYLAASQWKEPDHGSHHRDFGLQLHILTTRYMLTTTNYTATALTRPINLETHASDSWTMPLLREPALKEFSVARKLRGILAYCDAIVICHDLFSRSGSKSSPESA
jgi:hypothetical protein